jgi:site-specific DNA recombinase
MDHPIYDAERERLTGLLFDDAGHRMVPTHATKAGVRYRYYVSLPNLNPKQRLSGRSPAFRRPTSKISS